MKLKKLNFCKLIFTFFLPLLINSCSNKCVVNDIEVSELLSTVAREKSIDYCELLKEALAGDKNAIEKLSLLDFEEAVGYDQGAVIVDLIVAVGETEYIKAISTINGKQKDLTSSHI